VCEWISIRSLLDGCVVFLQLLPCWTYHISVINWAYCPSSPYPVTHWSRVTACCSKGRAAIATGWYRIKNMVRDRIRFSGVRVGIGKSVSKVATFLDHIARTTYVGLDAVYCYRPSSVVCPTVILVSPAKTAEPIEMPFGLLPRTGPGRHQLDRVQISPWDGAILGERVAYYKVYSLLPWAVQKRLNWSICCLGLWTRVGLRKHRFNHIRQVAPMCPEWMAHWRHVENTIQPSVCCSDAVLLLPPYGIGQTIIFLPYGFFYLLLSFFPRLISAVTDWMSAILPRMRVWP